MENKVGTTLPTQQEIEQINQDLESLLQRINKWGVVLNSEQRQAAMKIRTGGEAFIPPVMDTAKAAGVNIPGMPLAGMEADWKLYSIAKTVEEKAALLHQLISDTRLQSGSETWQAWLGHYSVLTTLATRDNTVAAKIKGAVEFMSTGPRKKNDK